MPFSLQAIQQHIAVIGECMIELFGHPPQLTQGFAGDTLNTAVYLSRLTQEQPMTVSYMTAIGTCTFSESMLQLWQNEGIDCSKVLRVPDRNPGLYIISVSDQGERSFAYWRGESAAKVMFDCDGAEQNLAALREFEWIYLSGITLAILTDSGRQKLLAALDLAKQAGAKVVFDNNYRPKLWPSTELARQHYDDLLRRCDMALLTLEDEQLLCPDCSPDESIEYHRSLGVDEMVIKRGAEPCLVATAGARYSIPACKVDRVVDTTAAGDSFSAAYLAARVCGLDVEEAAKRGHALAAQVIQHPGALIERRYMTAS